MDFDALLDILDIRSINFLSAKLKFTLVTFKHKNSTFNH